MYRKDPRGIDRLVRVHQRPSVRAMEVILWPGTPKQSILVHRATARPLIEGGARDTHHAFGSNHAIIVGRWADGFAKKTNGGGPLVGRAHRNSRGREGPPRDGGWWRSLMRGPTGTRLLAWHTYSNGSCWATRGCPIRRLIAGRQKSARQSLIVTLLDGRAVPVLSHMPKVDVQELAAFLPRSQGHKCSAPPGPSAYSMGRRASWALSEWRPGKAAAR